MTSQLPRFWCFFAAASWEKETENGAAVTSLRSFLFRDDFRTIRTLVAIKKNTVNINFIIKSTLLLYFLAKLGFNKVVEVDMLQKNWTMETFKMQSWSCKSSIRFRSWHFFDEDLESGWSSRMSARISFAEGSQAKAQIIKMRTAAIMAAITEFIHM